MEKYLTATAPSTLLEAEVARIDEIKTAAGVPQQVFEHFYVPMLNTFAANVQGLPLAPDAFAHRNGAFEFGLIASMIALRYAKTQIFFPDVGSEERRVLEPQCRFAAFVATLASAVSMTAQNCAVYAGSHDDDYHPLVCPVPLHKWLQLNPTATVQWRPKVAMHTAAQNGAIAARFIPTGMLNNFDLRVAMMIYGAIAPQLASNGIETTLERVVRQTISKVLDHHAQQEAKRFNHAESAGHIDSQKANSIADSLIQSTKPVEEVDITKPATARTAASKPEAAPAAPPAQLVSTEEFMRRLPTPLQEWFAAVIADPNYETVKTHITITESGVEIPIKLLGSYGVGGPIIQKLMKDANVIIDRSEDGRRYVLDTAVKGYLFAEDKDAA